MIVQVLGVEANHELMRSQLLMLLGAWSEERWAASWMKGIEFEAWADGGVWHVLGYALGEWPYRPGSEVEWVPLDVWSEVWAKSPFGDGTLRFG